MAGIYERTMQVSKDLYEKRNEVKWLKCQIESDWSCSTFFFYIF